MPRTVSASEAKSKFGAITEWVVANQDAVIVENHGKPSIVIIPYAEYVKLQALREQDRRQSALEAVRRIRAEVRAQNQDLTPEEADELAKNFRRDLVVDMVAEGKSDYTSG